VVIKNGGMYNIITTNENERIFYSELEAMDARMQKARNFFRMGNSMQDGKNGLF